MDITLQRTETLLNVNVSLTLNSVTFTYDCTKCQGIPSRDFGELPCIYCSNTGRLSESHTLESFRERVGDSDYFGIVKCFQKMLSEHEHPTG